MKYKSLPIVPAHIIKIWVSTYYPILNMTCVYFFNEKDDDETDFLFNQTFLNLEIERNFFSDCCVLQKKILICDFVKIDTWMREFLHENHRHESEGNSSTTIDVSVANTCWEKDNRFGNNWRNSHFTISLLAIHESTGFSSTSWKILIFSLNISFSFEKIKSINLNETAPTQMPMIY